MCDKVTIDQQRKEEQNAMTLVRDNSPVSEEFLRTGQWIQDIRSEVASPPTGGYWPNSIKTAIDALLYAKAARGHPKRIAVLVAKTLMIFLKA